MKIQVKKPILKRDTDLKLTGGGGGGLRLLEQFGLRNVGGIMLLALNFWFSSSTSSFFCKIKVDKLINGRTFDKEKTLTCLIESFDAFDEREASILGTETTIVNFC